MSPVPADDIVLDLQADESAIAEPGTFLLVRCGTVDVFLVGRGGDGAPDDRNRRYLFTVAAGDAIFPLDGPSTAAQSTTLAVALTPAQLMRRSLDTAPAWRLSSTDETTSALLDAWATRLGATARFVPPQIDVSSNAWRQTLTELHGVFLANVKAIERGERERRVAIAETRERLARAATGRALDELASAATASRSASKETHDGAPLAAAVSAVAEAQGIRLRVAPTDLTGDFDRDLDRIQRASHLRFRRVLLSGAWWREDAGPLLARTAVDGAPVALLPASASRYELIDPRDPVRRPVTEKTAPEVAPAAHMLYRKLPDTIAGPMDLVRLGLQGRRRDLVMASCAGIAATLLGMLMPAGTAIVFSEAIPDANRTLLLQVAAILVAATVARALFDIVQNLAMLRTEAASSAAAQASMWDRLLDLPLVRLRAYSAGDLQGRVDAVEHMRQAFGASSIQTLLGSVLALLNLALMFYYSPSLAVMAAAIAMGVMATTIVAGRFSLAQLHPLMRVRGELHGLVVQLIQAVSKLKVAGAESRAFARWAVQYEEQRNRLRNMRTIQDRVSAFNGVLPTISAAALFALAGQSITGSGASLGLGVFLAFNVAFGTFIAGTAAVSNSAMTILSAVQLWRRAKPILEIPLEADFSKATPGPLRGDIALDHVTFRYREDGPLILDDVSLRADAGEFVAVVGPSGSGKSTIFRLLVGFNAPQSGAVLVDQQDLSGLDVREVRRQLGVVLQNSYIMPSSIFENIAAGTRLTLTEAWDAASRAGLAEDLASFPMQMHTYVSEGGTNLSGGQRQRLLIARALARNPSILLLDEATSALDNHTQATVSRSLEKLGVTRIVIAHRLSTIRNADRIYVIDAGRIVQQGRFDDLAATEGLFSRLMSRQRL